MCLDKCNRDSVVSVSTKVEGTVYKERRWISDNVTFAKKEENNRGAFVDTTAFMIITFEWFQTITGEEPTCLKPNDLKIPVEFEIQRSVVIGFPTRTAE